MLFIVRYAARLFAVCTALVVVAALFAFAPPKPFPEHAVVVIKRGHDHATVARALKDAGVIAHPLVLRAFLKLTGGSVRSGAYEFTESLSLPHVAYRLAVGDYGIPPVSITLREGQTVRDYARVVAANLPEVSINEFIDAGKEYEGYLFPDTYTFFPDADADQVVKTMKDAFDAKLAPLQSAIASSTLSYSEVIVLASLLEREARTLESKRMIAGILFNRLARNMPLQVDAVFGYIFDRPTYSPSYEDLKVESPYNTYIHKGLPPTPIANPGLESIEAALSPKKSNYLFYLTGRDGVMRYAVTYAEHLLNQKKYLP